MSNAVLILGAAGFIGRHLSETLARSGTPVIAATRSPAAFVNPGISNVVAPFDDPTHFVPLLARCHAVIHAASSSTPGSSAAQPQLDGNLRPTLALIEALQACPNRRLVYLSSGGTLYGDRERAAREDDPLRPRSYHGAGKAAAEHFAHAWATQYDGTVVVLRPSNVYGPGQLPRQGFGIIPTAFDCALRGEPLTVWGDGSTIRDYLYVDDLVALCGLVLATDLPLGAHTYNVAYGEGISLDTLLDAVDETTGRPLRREHQSPRRVDVHRIVPDSSAVRAALGWHPTTRLEQGLRETWQWFATRP
ncbi:MAG TPA: NAD-dependent epimerase/dehydratase family protein [Lysobacter sp.]